MKNILVTGGCGFIGLNLAEAWLTRGDEVVLFDRNPLPPEAARAFAALPGEVVVTQGDIQDGEAVGTALHAAAPASVAAPRSRRWSCCLRWASRSRSPLC